MKAACRQDVGRRREKNEDSILVDEGRGIFLLADGLGGRKAGEVASAVAVERAHACLRAGLGPLRPEEIPGLLVDALFAAHEAVRDKAAGDAAHVGMGTTLVEVVIRDGTAYICQIGDSRVYVMRDELRQITYDHTLARRRMDAGVPESEIDPGDWYTLVQAVGLSEVLVPDSHCLELGPSDVLLLCSDGLTDMLGDEDIGRIIADANGDLERAAGALVEAANANGGEDNISVILLGPRVM